MSKRIAKIILFSLIGCLQLANCLTGQALADEVKITIPIWEESVTEDADGYVDYSGKNVQYLTQSGEPMVPFQVIKVLLPPDADFKTISVTAEHIKVNELAGQWTIRPKPPIAMWDGNKMTTIWPKGKSIIDGYDISIYEKEAFFPENWIGPISTGQTRQWRMVDIPVAMLKFNPVTKRLQYIIEGEIIIAFDSDVNILHDLRERTGNFDRIGEACVEKLTINFDEVSSSYEESIPQDRTVQQVSRYVLITTDNIIASSTALQDFVSSKEKRGFFVEIADESIWGGGTGDIAAENIRNWLKENYENKNIEYVLLIGNPDPYSGNVPMKMLWPRSDATTDRASPSDYYYADLTGNWDIDGDGLYGEWDDDFSPGGVDRNWDVIVGRIPYYGNINDLDKIFTKIAAYENETSGEVAWRQNSLLPMKPSDSNTPGYHLGEAIKNDIITPKGSWNYHRVYDEDYGLTPPPETYPCTYDNVTNAWNSSEFGTIFWWTHGWSRGASSIMDLSHAETLDDNYPGFSFQSSCSNSYPEDDQNISYALLKNGCIGTIGATRVSWYYPGQTSFIGSTSNSGMNYEYAKRLIENEMDSGYALYEMKQTLIPGIWMNFTVFNIYGDPSTGLFTFKTRIQNPDNGHWYQRFDNTMTWHDAKAHCESLSGHLATLTSHAEHDFVFDNLVVDAPYTMAWIGATDEEQEGVWNWVTGEAWEFTRWASGEPLNCAGIEHYLTLFTPNALPERVGYWNDLGTGNNGGCGCQGCIDSWYPVSAICEWDALSTAKQIACLSDNWYVRAEDGGDENGDDIRRSPLNDDLAKWELLPDGIYYRIQLSGTDFYLSAEGPEGSIPNGRNVHLWTWADSDLQRWEMILDGSSVRLRCVEGDIYLSGAGEDDNIHLWGWVGSDLQRWEIQDVTPEVCEGDFDGNGVVDDADLSVFAIDFGRADCSGTIDCPGDFNADNDVDGTNLSTFCADYGRTDCP